MTARYASAAWQANDVRLGGGIDRSHAPTSSSLRQDEHFGSFHYIRSSSHGDKPCRWIEPGKTWTMRTNKILDRRTRYHQVSADKTL
jgi:hypothetical protein